LKYKTNLGFWVNKLKVFAVRSQHHFSEILRCGMRTRFANTAQYANNYFSVCIISRL